jgi:hypothetical protein
LAGQPAVLIQHDLLIIGELRPPVFEGGPNRLSHAWPPRRPPDPALKAPLQLGFEKLGIVKDLSAAVQKFCDRTSEPRAIWNSEF